MSTQQTGSYVPRCSMSIGDFVGNLDGIEGPLSLGETQSTLFVEIK